MSPARCVRKDRRVPYLYRRAFVFGVLVGGRRTFFLLPIFEARQYYIRSAMRLTPFYVEGMLALGSDEATRPAEAKGVHPSYNTRRSPTRTRHDGSRAYCSTLDARRLISPHLTRLGRYVSCLDPKG